MDALMKKTGSHVDREGVKARVSGLPALDVAALALREALLVAIEGGHVNHSLMVFTAVCDTNPSSGPSTRDCC